MKKVLLCVISLFCICMINKNESVSAMGHATESHLTFQEGISITPASVVMVEGETKQLSAGDYTTNSSYSLVWTSSNVAVATVNGTGLVTAVAEGSATITCTANMETNFFAPPSGTCTVTVKKKVVEPQNITFADAEVKRICVKNWDTNGDGELSYDEAAAVTDIGEIFRGNESISSFEELVFFTNLASIADGAFRNCYGMTTLNIPNSVTSIGRYAFADCHNMATVTIPNSVTTLSICSFENCSSLVSVTIPGSVAVIENDAFLGCSSMSSLNISDGVTTICGYAFKGCSSLTSITIPNSVTNIYAYAFQDCSGLTSVSIPTNMTSIDEGVFNRCSSLASVSIPNKVTTIEKLAFSGCTNLTSVDIPSRVNSIGDYAFDGCGLISVTIPNGVKSIGGRAFSGCDNLTSVTISKSVNLIGDMVFSSCNKLETIVIESGNTKYDSRDNCNAIIETASNTLIIGCKNTTIPNSVTKIGIDAFTGCSSLSSVIIPNSVTSIGVWSEMNGTSAFVGCKNIETIVVESENTKYDSRGNCNALIQTSSNLLLLGCKNTVIPNTVTAIGGYAFHSCTGLTSIIIPKSVTSIGGLAFNGCSGLTSVTVKADTPPSLKDNSFPKTKTYNSIIDATLYVPKGCKAIYEAANYWKDFKEIIEKENSITFADDEVKRICVENWDTDGDGELSYDEAAAVTDLDVAFKDAKSITSFNELQYFTGLTSIGDRAFYNCEKLSCLIIPESVTSIGTGAFYNCDLKSVYIPANIANIGNYTLEYNKNLTTIQVDAANTHYDSRNQCNAIIETATNKLIQGSKTTAIPSEVKEIGAFAFEHVDLTHIDLPQSLEEIAWCSFYGCSNLDEVVFPNGLKTISRYAYNGCTSLKNIVIPASVESLGGATFAGCYNIETLTVAPGSETYISPEGSNAIVSKDGSTLVIGCKNTIIPETVVTIGYESFRDQSHLTAISIPAHVTTLEDNAFCGCTALTVIDIPKSVASIGEYAFSGCQAQSVIIRRSTPIAITSNVFTNYANATLSVPKGSKASYEAADCWKEFKEIVELDDETEPDDEIEVTDISQMANAIYIEPFTARMGREANIEVKVKNANAITSYGFELVLPEGMSISVDEDGAFDNALTLSSRNSEHTVMTNKLADNIYKIAVVSFSSKSLTGQDGLVLTVKTHIDAGMTTGTYPVKVQNPLIVNKDFTKPSLQETVTAVTITENPDLSDLDNIIYLDNVQGVVDQQLTLDVKMNNTDAITGVQFDLYLPEGIELCKDEYADYLIDLSRTTTRRHSISSQVMNDGALRVVVSSTQNATFSDNSGTLLTFVLLPKSTLEAGNYDVMLKNIVLTDPQATRYVSPDTKGVISIATYTLGDVNNDSYIDVADLAGVVCFILDNADESLIFKAADMDGNGVIEVNDFAALVNVILAQNAPKNAPKRRANAVSNRLINLSYLSLNNFGEGELAVCLDNNDMHYTNIQFDLRLPDGIELQDEGAEASDAHHGAWVQKYGDGTYRVICSSMMNNEFNEGDILHLQIKVTGTINGNSEIEANNVILSDENALRHEASSVKTTLDTDYATGIGNPSLSEGEEAVYDLSGRKMFNIQSSTPKGSRPNGENEVPMFNGLQKGIYIVNRKKTAITK